MATPTYDDAGVIYDDSITYDGTGERVTQAARVALTSGEPSARVTQAARIALASGQPTARITQVARIVLVQNVAPDTARSEGVWRD